MEFLLLVIELFLDFGAVLIYLNPFLLLLFLDKLLDVAECLVIDLLLFFNSLVLLIKQLANHGLLLLKVSCQAVAAVGDVGLDGFEHGLHVLNRSATKFSSIIGVPTLSNGSLVVRAKVADVVGNSVDKIVLWSHGEMLGHILRTLEKDP